MSKELHFKTSINSLPLIKKEVQHLVKTHKGISTLHAELLTRIKIQSQLNQANRLQQSYQRIVQRMESLDQMQRQHCSDPRSCYLEIMKLDLAKIISPKEQLNHIAEEANSLSGRIILSQQSSQKLKRDSPNVRMKDQPPILTNQKSGKEQQSMGGSRLKQSPTKSIKSPVLSDKKLIGSPLKTPVKVPTLNVKAINKPVNRERIMSQHSDLGQLDVKTRKISQTQQKSAMDRSMRVQPKIGKYELSQRFMNVQEKRANINSLQQLRLTIKMTKEEYIKYVKMVESSDVDTFQY